MAWFERVRALPIALRLGTVVVLVLATLGAGLPLGQVLPAGQLQIILLAGVLVGALVQGLAAGFVVATAGFGVMLWRAVESTAGGGWTLAFQAAFDAFLWFAVAKLAATLVAAPHGAVAQLAAARRRAEAEVLRRELLLSEMAHRVGNDIGLLAGMLQMQAAADPGAAAALRAAAGRVHVLSRLHGRLSPGAAPATAVDSRQFLEGLVVDLRAGMDGLRSVALTVAAEAHALPLARAADIGLVVNELVTNALKHAFPGRSEGIVRVSFRRDGGAYELVVADNGAGIAPGRAAQSGGGFGNQLMRALAGQLGGRLEVSSGEVGGTVCRLRFPLPRPGAESTALTAAAIRQTTAQAQQQEVEPQYSRRRRR